MSDTTASRREIEARERAQLSPLAVFADACQDRPDPESADEFRTAIVRDRDRVLHSGAFRRLQGKTQVFVIDEGDFYRTRLTHTLEVVQIARYLARCLRLNEDLAEVLALVHDIGHPPFGHEGEEVLNTLPGVPFDHNSQALRIVDVLECPYADRRGLNLTQLTRRMILKHGGEAGRGAAPTIGHVLEAQVSDLADSTAYQHHDLEDGLRSGLLRVGELEDLAIWRHARERVELDPGTRVGRKAVLNAMLKASLTDLLVTTQAALNASKLRAAAAVDASGAQLVRRSPERERLHAELGAFLHERFYRHSHVRRSARHAKDALTTLVGHYHSQPEELPADYRARLEQDGSARTVCDYVAGMTDRFAMDEGRRLARRASVSVPTTEPGNLDEAVDALQRILGLEFADRRLAVTALTHSSARTELRLPNERLEFLGDAVLGAVVAQVLYERYPEQPEGELSRMKSATVSRHALLCVARQWDLGRLIETGPGFRGPEEVPDSLVANAVEAVLGAVYLDQGLEVVGELIRHEFGDLLARAAGGRRSRNAKSVLQAYTQGEHGLTPHYRVIEEDGPDHSKNFTVAVVVGDEELAVARGRNKRQAEQRAARTALHMLVGASGADPNASAPLDPAPQELPDVDSATRKRKKERRELDG